MRHKTSKMRTNYYINLYNVWDQHKRGPELFCDLKLVGIDYERQEICGKLRTEYLKNAVRVDNTEYKP